MAKIKVVLADDHYIVRNGIKNLLDMDEIEVVGEANDGFEAIELVKNLSPDVLMIDITMPKMNGLDATGIVTKQYKGTKTLILSMHENEDYILKAVEEGALGYLLKDSSKEEILDAIKTVYAGNKYFNGPVSNIIINGYLNSVRNSGNQENQIVYKISKKEKEILGHIIDGKNSREIAEMLELSVRTVDNHRANMMKRLEVKNAVELVKLALDKKLV